MLGAENTFNLTSQVNLFSCGLKKANSLIHEFACCRYKTFHDWYNTFNPKKWKQFFTPCDWKHAIKSVNAKTSSRTFCSSSAQRPWALLALAQATKISCPAPKTGDLGAYRMHYSSLNQLSCVAMTTHRKAVEGKV